MCAAPSILLSAILRFSSILAPRHKIADCFSEHGTKTRESFQGINKPSCSFLVKRLRKPLCGKQRDRAQKLHYLDNQNVDLIACEWAAFQFDGDSFVRWIREHFPEGQHPAWETAQS